MLVVPSKINTSVKATSGLDSLDTCRNKKHFLNYKKKITYKYNSRGFRDEEFPSDLSEVIWCIGDSFTTGIGQPLEECWPKLLEKKTKKRCINLGEDGCSNDTIALRAQETNKLYKPKLLVIMWTYLHRRRVKDQDVHYDENTANVSEDVNNFLKNYKIVNNLPAKVVHLLIPNACIMNEKILHSSLSASNIDNVLSFPQLDYARDYHHFDIKTSELVCDIIINKLKYFDKPSK